MNLDLTPRVTLDGDIMLDLTVENSSVGRDVLVNGITAPSFAQRVVTTRAAAQGRRVEPAGRPAAGRGTQVASGLPGRHSPADPETSVLGQRQQRHADRHRDAPDAAHRADQGNHGRGSPADLHRVGTEHRPRRTAAVHQRARGHPGAGDCATGRRRRCRPGAIPGPGGTIVAPPPGSSPIPGTITMPAPVHAGAADRHAAADRDTAASGAGRRRSRLRRNP